MKARHLLNTAPLVLAASLLATTVARAQAPAAAPPPPPSVKTGQAAPEFSANYLTMGENGELDSIAQEWLADYLDAPFIQE